MTRQTIHANCLVIGTCGLLIRGPSGSGKSVLTRALIEAAHRKGNFAALVSDDRTVLDVDGERLIASPPPAIAGKLEVRGFGIFEGPFLSRARITLVVDLLPGSALERMPEQEEFTTHIEGLRLRRSPCPANSPSVSIDLIRRALAVEQPASPDYI